MKTLLLLILLIPTFAQAQDVTVYVENSMMTAVGPDSGALDLGTFDPFNPSFNCNSFIAPNSCNVSSRDLVDLNLEFNYFVEINSGASSVDLSFSVNNGLGGTTGSFTNVVSPGPIFNLQNQGSGIFDVSLGVPLFGPDSRLNYGMDLIINVTINP
jgi:hypothetical protein